MGAPARKLAFGEAVDLAHIPEALRVLRLKLAGEAKDPVGSRVCTLNLAAFSTEPASHDAALRVLESLLGEHPGRMFLVNSDRRAGASSLEARVSVDGTSPSTGFSPAYSEVIDLRARGTAIDHLPAILTSLLDPDQPACAWWVDTPGFGEMWRRTSRVADRMVVDTGTMDPWDLMRLVEYVRSDTVASAADDHAALGDLSWARIKPFQALCARFFDAPRVREGLSGLERLTISYSTPKGSATAVGPALLASWTRNRALRCAQKQRCRLKLTVALQPVERPDLQPGEVSELLLSGGGLELAVSRPVDAPQYAVGEARAGADDLSPQHLKIRTGDVGWLLAQELQIVGRDPLFEACLLDAVDILRDARP